MSFISILFALLLEQARPLALVNPVHNGVRYWVRWVIRHLDTDTRHHGWMAWALAVVAPAALVCALHWVLLLYLGWIAAVVWSIAILYSTLGFRQFSHHFTTIRDALLAGDEDQARAHLGRWMHLDASSATLPRAEIVRHVIEYSVVSAHRCVFGVFAWYSLLAVLGLGPAGAVLYRIGEYFYRHTLRPRLPFEPPVSPALQANARWAWSLMDWLPARITALGFAFVGSFEDAVDSWRQHEAQFPGDNDGVVLASTAGAVGVRLGAHDRFGASGQTPQAAHLHAVVALVWRNVVMWMVFLALLSLARLLG